MCKGALACSASPSHALALCTAVKGSRPLASSAAIADASVQPASMQVRDFSAMVSSAVRMRCVVAMLLGQKCCCDTLFLECKRSTGAPFADTSACINICMCRTVGWTADRQSVTSGIQSHSGTHAGTDRQRQRDIG